MNICYGASHYRSFMRPASAYKQIIQRSWHLVEDPQSADLVIIHSDPTRYPYLFNRHRSLNRSYVVGYVTWEADSLPKEYADNISMLDEVWTCSQYCYHILKGSHLNVQMIPHVIKRDKYCSDDEVNQIKKAIQFSPDCIYFLAITHINDKRKNVQQLMHAFSLFHQSRPDAILIIKGFGRDTGFVCLNGVRILTVDLTDSELNALYKLAHIYVSAHHSEGWGLTMSDAILFDKPVIATQYSGNLDYMDSDSAYLIPCEVTNIKPEDCEGLFDEKMRWGNCDTDAIIQQLSRAYYDHVEGQSEILVRRAHKWAGLFSEETVERTINLRLDAIVKTI